MLNPRLWTVAYIPTPRGLCLLADCCRSGSKHADPMGSSLRSKRWNFPFLSLAEVGTTVSLITCSKWPQCPWKHFQSHANSFFPRVRTPCGHGAQVIVEGREEKTDGGERNEDQPKTKPKPAGRLHHLVVFPVHWVKRVKLRLVTTSGPEFAKDEDCSASCVHGKPPRRLQTDFPCQVLDTTVWQNKVTLQVRCLAMLQQWL